MDELSRVAALVLDMTLRLSTLGKLGKGVGKALRAKAGYSLPTTALASR